MARLREGFDAVTPLPGAAETCRHARRRGARARQRRLRGSPIAAQPYSPSDCPGTSPTRSDKTSES